MFDETNKRITTSKPVDHRLHRSTKKRRILIGAMEKQNKYNKINLTKHASFFNPPFGNQKLRPSKLFRIDSIFWIRLRHDSRVWDSESVWFQVFEKLISFFFILEISSRYNLFSFICVSSRKLFKKILLEFLRFLFFLKNWNEIIPIHEEIIHPSIFYL